MQFTNTVTVTCDLRSLRSAIKHSGGGLVGIAAIVTDLVEQMRDSLEAIGVELRNWLDIEAIDEMLALAMNPTSFAAESRNDGPNRLAPVMGIEERWDHVQIDGSVHRTFWIAEWPRSEISVGFLDKLLYSGDATRVLTLSVRPVPTHKALSQVGRAKVDLEVARGLRQRRGMITTREQDREYEDLSEREDDIVDGFTDMEFRGFVTVSAADVDGLTRASASILQSAQPARVTLAAMYFQQAAAFMSTALPTPVGKQ
nr:SCO6880 family protein [Plantibacter sp. M259]